MKYTYCPVCRSELHPEDQGYLSCSSDHCQFIYYDNPTPVVAAIVEYRPGQILLAHNKLWPPKWYGLITGFVEKNELPEHTVIREVKEELNLEGTIKSFIGHYGFKRMNQLIMAYHISAHGEVVLNEELDDYKIIPFEKIKCWPAGTGLALRDFLEARGYHPEMLSFP